MSDRSYSHKSDGRQSSAGHSVASGRANSLTGLGPILPLEPPGLAPGFFILGSVPAIIRCWLDTNFKHDTLLYAAVCSGSFASYLDLHLVELLGLHDQVTRTDEGTHKVKISLYLPEAVPVSGSSRSNSPAPQLPSIAVDFTVIEEHNAVSNPKAIQIFLGSDILRAHNADVLFSTNRLTLYDDDRTKLQIPLVRPEDDRTFKSVSISSRPRPSLTTNVTTVGTAFADHHEDPLTMPLCRTAPREPLSATIKPNGFGTTISSDDGTSSGRRSLEQRPQLGLATATRTYNRDASESSPISAAPRSGPLPAMLSNWRRDSSEKTNAGSLDWANVGKTTSSASSYKPRDTGMKVLKPTKSISRTHSNSTSSPAAGQSRFFDDGKRRGENETNTGMAAPQVKRTISGEKAKENLPLGVKTRSANPVGGASAFSWLNSGGAK
jgi:ubiquitin carboxyl-terminal hydrolase 4/11/15